MSAPITWKNINDPAATASSVGNRSNALNQSQSAFEAMSRSLGAALTHQQGIRQHNRDNEIGNNTQDFRNLLSQFQSPEQLEAAREQGVFQNFLDDRGRMIDQSVANQGAVDSRLSGLRQQQLADREYADSQQRFNTRDLRNELDTFIAKDDVVGAQALFDEQGSNLPNPAAVQQQITQLERNLLEQGRKDLVWNRSEEERQRNLDVNTLLNNRVREFREQGIVQDERWQADATALNIPFNEETGEFDYQSASPEAIEEMARNHADGRYTTQTDTQARNALAAELRTQYPDMAEADIQERVTEFSLGIHNQLGPQDQAFIGGQLERVREIHDIDRNVWNATDERPPLEQGQSLVSKWFEEDSGLTNPQRDEAVGMVAELIGEGIDIFENGEPIPIPFGVLDLALSKATTDILQNRSKLTKHLKDVAIKANLAGQYETMQNYRNDVRTVEAEAMRRAGNQNNIPARAARLQDALPSPEPTRTEPQQPGTGDVPVEALDQALSRSVPAEGVTDRSVETAYQPDIQAENQARRELERELRREARAAENSGGPNILQRALFGPAQTFVGINNSSERLNAAVSSGNQVDGTEEDRRRAQAEAIRVSLLSQNPEHPIGNMSVEEIMERLNASQ